jgi:hypothetical protein
MSSPDRTSGHEPRVVVCDEERDDLARLRDRLRGTAAACAATVAGNGPEELAETFAAIMSQVAWTRMADQIDDWLEHGFEEGTPCA